MFYLNFFPLEIQKAVHSNNHSPLEGSWCAPIDYGFPHDVNFFGNITVQQNCDLQSNFQGFLIYFIWGLFVQINQTSFMGENLIVKSPVPQIFKLTRYI